MKKSTKLFTKSRTTSIFIAGGILGAIVFFIIYGFVIINPTYDAWLLNQNSDMTQHYLGWMFFRRSDWSFPFGLTDGLVSGTGISCMFTDSIPLFAIFFKILSPILPQTFQYIGLWGLTSYILQGALASLILHKFNKNMLFCLIGSLFYIVSPVMLHRMYLHESLAGHWIILIAISIWVYHDYQWKKKATPIILWSLNGVLAVLVHTYFIPMVYLILLGYCITDICKTKKVIKSILCFISTTFFSLLTMFCLGAFYGNGDIQAGGLGTFSANLNSLFNSMGTSKFLLSMNIRGGQGEGFGYLGLGMMFAIFFAIALILTKTEKSGATFFSGLKNIFQRNKFKIIAFSAVIFLSVFLAASPVVTLNARVLFTIKYPHLIHSILSVFRASGRFIWVTDYLIYTAVLALISKFSYKKAATLLLTLCVGIQLLDMRDFAKTKRETFSKKIAYTPVLSDPIWNELAKDTNEIIFIPIDMGYLEDMKMYFAFGKYAYDHDMTLSSFYLARASYKELSEYSAEQLRLLNEGKGNPDALYVFTDKEIIPINKNTEGVTLYSANGFNVAKFNEE